jgi:hypothetical protein
MPPLGTRRCSGIGLDLSASTRLPVTRDVTPFFKAISNLSRGTSRGEAFINQFEGQEYGIAE